METLTSLAKRKGFVYPSSDIYGGFGSTWDYGPLGTELIRNVKAVSYTHLTLPTILLV